MAEYKLELKGVSKSFPGVKALDNVQLSLRPGSVLALMGENGAGKSTLMKCLFGIYHMDAGEIYIDGEKVEIKDPDDAMEKGIAMVHQELQPVPARSIAENMYLGRFPVHKYGQLQVIDHKTMNEETKRWLAQHLTGCHNFYPHRYTGLSLDHFISCTQNFKKYGLHTAAFVGCASEDCFGPWIAKEGLCTLEMHRNLPLDVQIKHMIEIGLIDDILISNCYPSEEEMRRLKKLDLSLVTFEVEPVESLPELFHKVIFDELQMNRGDVNENMIRSTQTRVKYASETFPIFNAPAIIKRGDVMVESSEHGHYAGEVQIAKADMENTGLTNVIGHVREEELFLLDDLRPWQKFRFMEK